jgi:hypothetical protein
MFSVLNNFGMVACMQKMTVRLKSTWLNPRLSSTFGVSLTVPILSMADALEI